MFGPSTPRRLVAAAAALVVENVRHTHYRHDPVQAHRIAIGRVVVGSGRARHLRVDELSIGELRVERLSIVERIEESHE